AMACGRWLPISSPAAPSRCGLPGPRPRPIACGSTRSWPLRLGLELAARMAHLHAPGHVSGPLVAVHVQANAKGDKSLVNHWTNMPCPMFLVVRGHVRRRAKALVSSDGAPGSP